MNPNLPFHTASRNPPGAWVVNNLLIGPALGRAFRGVYMYADPAALRLREEPGVPIIFCSTHTSWWDGYMAGVVNRAWWKRDGYLMMEEVNLARYPFFTWVGVYGVDRDDPRKALASIEYTAALLNEEPNRAVWMFPQGTITHTDTRPLRLYGGASHIARRTGQCALVPVALRYEFRMEQAPEVFVRVGPAIRLDPGARRIAARELTEQLNRAMSENDDALHADLVASNLKRYRKIRSGRGSTNRVWDGVLKLLGVKVPEVQGEQNREI